MLIGKNSKHNIYNALVFLLSSICHMPNGTCDVAGNPVTLHMTEFAPPGCNQDYSIFSICEIAFQANYFCPEGNKTNLTKVKQHG